MLSMDLSIQKLTKSFNQQRVFDNLTFTIPSGSRFAITGPNGSGKSTLIKILSGGLLPTSGMVEYKLYGKPIPEETIYKYVHFVAPYNTVIEELNLLELFGLHQSLGLLSTFASYRQWVDKLEYDFDSERQIKAFSSGMKQRVKLGLTLLDNRPLILLDEPGSTLDVAGKDWLFRLIRDVRDDQTVVMATNEPSEIEICSASISVINENP